MALPVPGTRRIPVLTAAPITALADELARDALTGKRPAAPAQPLDVSPVTRARQDDQAALDRAALARELRAAAAVVLRQVFSGEQRPAGDRRHPGAAPGDRRGSGASGRGGCHPVPASRPRWKQAGSTGPTSWPPATPWPNWPGCARRIRLVDDGTPPEPDDGLSFCSALGADRQPGRDVAGPDRRHHARGARLAGVLAERCPRGPDYQFWLPTTAEQAARLAELRADRQAQRARAAAL